MSHRPAFEAAPRLFARVSEAMKTRGLLPPVPISAIWKRVSDTKAQAIIPALTCSDSMSMSLSAFVADVEQRRAETGITDLPRNRRAHRTPSKQALLKAIDDAGGAW